MLHHVLGLFIYIAWDQVLAGKNLLVKLVSIWVLKGKIANRHRIQNDSKTPYVSVETDVSFSCNHLGGSIARAATSSLECVCGIFVCVAEAKVYDFNVHVFIEQQVLWFQVSVANLVLV